MKKHIKTFESFKDENPFWLKDAPEHVKHAREESDKKSNERFPKNLNGIGIIFNFDPKEGTTLYENGIKRGDILTHVNGVEVEDWRDFYDKYSNAAESGKCVFTFLIDGNKKEITL